MRIAICDDDTTVYATLIRYILSLQAETILENNIDTYTCAEDLLASGKSYDIIFMDIYMAKLNGVDAATKLSKNKTRCIIFITTSKDYAVDAYQLGAIHYLLKPLQESDVHESLNRCIEKLRSTAEPVLRINIANEILAIPYRYITYIEASNKRTLIHTDNRTYSIYMSLDKMESMLDTHYFMRAQRSFIVNMGFIEDFNNNFIVLENGREISLSRNNQNSLKEQYQTYLFALTRRNI